MEKDVISFDDGSTNDFLSNSSSDLHIESHGCNDDDEKCGLVLSNADVHGTKIVWIVPFDFKAQVICLVAKEYVLSEGDIRKIAGKEWIIQRDSWTALLDERIGNITKPTLKSLLQDKKTVVVVSIIPLLILIMGVTFLTCMCCKIRTISYRLEKLAKSAVQIHELSLRSDKPKFDQAQF